jgi:subtilisin family serine protease
MYVQTAARHKIELVPLEGQLTAEHGQFVLRAKGFTDPGGRLSRVAGAFFGLRAAEGLATPQALSAEPPVGVFKEKQSGLLRVVHKELVIRFGDGVSQKKRQQILAKHGLEIRGQNRFIKQQFVVKHRKEKHTGAALVDLANQCMELDEVVFASPNFVSEFRRTQINIPVGQWHLENLARVQGQKLGEDVNAQQAWEITRGKRTIVVAVLDDGVDVDHPNLKTKIVRNPDPDEPRDLVGRDFFIPDEDHPEHFNPRPKIFQFPFDDLAGNDIHGTPCAGVIAAAGKSGGAFGIAPKCRILAVKIFHGDFLASDARVADAIRYAASHADILSCSWSGGSSADIELAIEDAGTIGRGGKGSAVFCAAGNDFGQPVGFPARLPSVIAVGASTDQGKLAVYSNIGPEIWVVAPSNGGKQGIFTTDVSFANRGFNLGSAAAGGADGLHTNSFGGTSSATPLAAGVGALVLSVKASLTRAELKQLLADTADRIGNDHDPTTGQSDRFGFGRVDAEAAVKKAQTL